MNNWIKGLCLGAGSAVLVGGLLIFVGKSLGGDMVTAVEMNGGFGPKVITTEKYESDYVYKQYDIEEFDTLNIDVTSMDVEIVKGTERKLEANAPEIYLPEISQKGGTLSIKQPRVNDVSLNFGVVFEENKTYYKLTVTDDDIIETNIKGTSGNVDVDGVNIDGNISFTSGEIMLSNVEAKNIDAHATSGEISLIDCNFSDGIIVESTSGSIEAEAVLTAKFRGKTTSGRMNFSDTKADELVIECTSGGIEADSLEASYIDASGTSGNISLKLEGNENDYNINVRTTSGDIEVGSSTAEREFTAKGDTDKTITVQITSGNVEVEFE